MLQTSKLLIFKWGTKTVLLWVANVKPVPPKITEFSELMILFVPPPIIELPLRQTLKLPPKPSLAVRPVVTIEFCTPPMIAELVEKQETQLSWPPIIVDWQDWQQIRLSQPPTTEASIEQKETELLRPPIIVDSQEEQQISLLQPPTIAEWQESWLIQFS